jgi:protein-tyrosine phosphatase
MLIGVDDGPDSPEAAVELAHAQLAAGVTKVAATPHVGFSWPLTAAELPASLAELRALLADRQIGLEVVAGAEIEALYAAKLGDDELRKLALGGGQWLLIEPPSSAAGVAFERIVNDLQSRGHKVLLAHVERSADIQRDPQILRRLVDSGALGQVTACALTGAYGRRTERFARELVGSGLVQNVCSDAHDYKHRPPGIDQAIAAAGLRFYSDWWCREIPNAILSAGAIPEPPSPWPPAPAQHGTLSRLFRGK